MSEEEEMRKAWRKLVKEVEALQKKAKKKEYAWIYDLLHQRQGVFDLFT